MCPNPATLRIVEGSTSTFMCDDHGGWYLSLPDPTILIGALRTPSYVQCGAVVSLVPPPMSYVPAPMSYVPTSQEN